MTSREIEGGAEVDVELHFFARDLAVAAGGLARFGMDAAGLHRVERVEGAHVYGREAEVAARGVAIVQFDIGRRIEARRHLRRREGWRSARAPDIQVVGKDAVNLDPNLADAAKRGAVCQQAGEGRAGD